VWATKMDITKRTYTFGKLNLAKYIVAEVSGMRSGWTKASNLGWTRQYRETVNAHIEPTNESQCLSTHILQVLILHFLAQRWEPS